MTMISTDGDSVRIVRMRSAPVMPGRLRSIVTNATSREPRMSRAWWPESVQITLWAGERIRFRDLREPASSSTTRIVFFESPDLLGLGWVWGLGSMSSDHASPVPDTGRRLDSEASPRVHIDLRHRRAASHGSSMSPCRSGRNRASPAGGERSRKRLDSRRNGRMFRFEHSAAMAVRSRQGVRRSGSGAWERFVLVAWIETETVELQLQDPACDSEIRRGARLVTV